MVNMQLAVEKGMGSFDELIERGSAVGASLGQIEHAVGKGGKELKNLSGAMGMSSTELRKMYKEADKSAISLVQFSEVAGMTNAQFAQMFKSNPAEAIMQFVVGLSKAEEQGTSAIRVLDDMDIKEVRLRDSLLRAANASGIFGKALSTSNTAFEENVALTKEAETKYATTASQMTLAKNKINDLAISFGNELLPAIASALEQSGPLIDMLSDMIKGFADASPETKKFAFSLGLFTVFGGPVLTTLGSLTKGLGAVAKGAGATAEWMGLANFGLTKASKSSALLGSEMGDLALKTGLTASKGTLFSSVFGSTGVMSVGAVLGVTTGVVVGAGLAIWGLHEAFEASERSGGRWGTSVTREQDKVLKKTKELSDRASVDMKLYETDVTKSAENIKNSFEAISNSIEKSIEKQKKSLDDAVSNLPETQQVDAKDASEKRKSELDKELELVKNQVAIINGIYENASQNKRNLTESESAYIKYLSKDLSAAQIKDLNLTEEQNKAVLSRISTDMSSWSSKELTRYKNDLKDKLNSSEDTLKKQVKTLKDIYKDNPIKMDEEIEKTTIAHKQAMDDMVRNYGKAVIASGHNLGEMREQWKAWGYTAEEVADLINREFRGVVDETGLMAKGVKEADIAWNSMVLDPKTGEVKTNINEVLKESLQSEEGWNNMMFMLKEANLTSNAREEVAIAIIESGKWDALSLDEKYIVANSDQAVVAYFDALQANGQWDAALPIIKELGVNNLDAIRSITDSKETLQAWNNMSPELKKLLVNNNDKSKIIESTRLTKEFDALPNPLKNIKISADTSGATQAKQAIDSVNDKNVVIRVTYQGKDTGNTAIHSEKGTNFHSGGDMIINDQKGSLYREAVRFPGGDWFIPGGRDVFIPNAPRGTQVMPAGMTSAKFKAYANGTGMDSSMFNKPIPFQNPRQFSEGISPTVVVNNDNGMTDSKLDQMINLLSALLTKNQDVILQEKVVGTIIEPTITSIQNRKEHTQNRRRGIK